MSLQLRVAQASELEEILDYEQKKLKESFPDENERTFQAWHARWRKESLEHYLPSGWCFLARDSAQETSFSSEGLLIGYFLAQPMLFLDGQTQSLWVEHVQYSSLQARDELCELAYRIAREKHLQRVYFPNTKVILNAISSFKPEEWGTQALVVKTTKA